MRYLAAVAVCLTLFLVLPAPADTYDVVTVGYVSPWGYTYGQDGYWHKGGRAYTRTLIPGTAGYWYCGRYYAGTESSYQYTEYVKPYTAPKVQKLEYSEQWRTEGLKLLAKRDDLNAFSNFVNSTNLNNYQVPDKYPGVYGGYAAGGGYGVSGQTLYARGGYNAFTASLYNTTDLNLSNMLAGRLTQNAQQLAGQAHSDFSAIVSQQADAASQIARIQALAAAVAPQPAVASTTFQFSQGVQGVPAASATTTVVPLQTPLMPRAADGSPDALVGLWSESCASCHSGAAAKAGFTLDVYRGMSRQAKIDKVWARLTSDDPIKLMPRGKDNVGHRLPDNKLQTFFNEISAMKVQ